MSRVKRSSGKEYRRLAQAGDSDEEVVLYPLSPPRLPPPSLSSTTEFGLSRYDKSGDLELPAPPLPSRNRRSRGAGLRRKGLRGSREARACVCFLGLLVLAVLVVGLAWLQLGGYGGAELSASPQLSSAVVPSSTVCVVPPSSSPLPGSPAEPTTQTEPHTTSPSTMTSAPATLATGSREGGGEGSEPPGTEPLSDPTTGETADSLTPSPDTPLTHSPSPLPPLTPHRGGGISWHREFFPALTETALQLRDLSGDGVSDVVMVEGTGDCEAVVRVLDGLTGDSVWQAHVFYDAFAVKCEVDLDRDGQVDCIAAGRQSGFRALRGTDGSTLWDRDPQLAFFPYNFYFPLFVPDLDGDGVQDIIATHGGDSSYDEEDRDRSPGFLVAVSGRTGQQLMERVPLPDGQETYNSPVLLPREGEGDLVLVGTGGETLPGSLWAFSFASLRERISRYLETERDYSPFTGYINHFCEKDMSKEEVERLRPVFDAGSFDSGRETATDPHLSHCRAWGPHQPVWNRFGLCLYRLVTGEVKGVLLPPVIIEMTGDSQYDLVVSVFEGKTLVINGNTGKVVWKLVKPGTESYSVPAPLFFNSDAVPDLLVRVNYGVWDTYNYSTFAVLDGQNGRTLWSVGSVKTGMMSGLSLAAAHPGADAAVFITMGEGNSSAVEGGNRIRAVLEQRERRHAGPHGPTQSEGEVGEEEGEDVFAGMDASGNPVTEDFMDLAQSYRDPPGLWDGLGTEFPDPISDLPSFLLEHCGWREEDLTASLYLLSPLQALSGSTPPLFSSGPFVYFPGYEEKRHSQPHAGHAPSSDRESWRELRCGHVMVPEKIFSTPAIGDVDGDGRLEIAYLVAWFGNAVGEMPQDLPPRFTLFMETLEDRVREVEGEEGLEWLEEILPAEQQPWTHYMGVRGDNIYHRHTP